MSSKISQLVVLVLLAISFRANAHPEAKTEEKKQAPPLVAQDDVFFLGKADQKMLDFGKVAEFEGILTRSHEKQSDLRTVDLYSFKDIPAKVMDIPLCKQLLARIYGPLDHITLKVTKTEIFKSHTGATCEAQINDPDQEAKFPQRKAILGFLNAKAFGLVFNLQNKSAIGVSENIRGFWDTLR